MVVTVADLANQALVEIGYKRLIEELYEGSVASRAVLEIYRQTRNELLDSADWPFARRTVALTLLKGPPPSGGYNPAAPWVSATYPRPGWLYEYAYPDDCLEFMAIVAQPGPMFDLNPQPAVWRVDNDSAYDPPRKVLLSNEKNALGVYTAEIIDISTWEPGFVQTLVKTLKTKLAVALGQDLNMEREGLAEATASQAITSERRG